MSQPEFPQPESPQPKFPQPEFSSNPPLNSTSQPESTDWETDWEIAPADFEVELAQKSDSQESDSQEFDSTELVPVQPAETPLAIELSSADWLNAEWLETQPSDAALGNDPNDLNQPDLNQIITELGDVQAELNYRQAQDVLRELLSRLNLSARERAGLEAQLSGLELMLDKLERQVIHIAVFGMVGRGKSSLLNALLGQEIFETGPTHGVTQTVQSAAWSVVREAVSGAGDVLRVSLPGAGQSCIELIDTPGIDEVDGETREALARELAKQADLILFVVAGDITKVEFEALSELRQASKPILLVFNKIDQYPQADRQAIYEKIRDERVRELLSPDEIVMAAASPLVAQALRRPDGQISAQLNRGAAQVEDLKLRILEILHQEGKSLVALNTMLYADDINEQIVQRKLAIRDRSADQVIWNTVMTKAVAIALNPVTVLDIFTSAIIDGTMIFTLSRLYGISMSQQGAIELLQKILVSMGGVTATELLGILGLGSLKGALGAAAPVTGGVSLLPYMAIALTQASIGGVASYSIGQVGKTYLANGATWGPDGPKAVVDRILASLDEASIMSRIKDELRAKLEAQRWNLR